MSDYPFSSKFIYENGDGKPMHDVPGNPEASHPRAAQSAAVAAPLPRSAREPSRAEIADAKLEMTSPAYLDAKVTHESRLAGRNGFHP